MCYFSAQNVKGHGQGRLGRTKFYFFSSYFITTENFEVEFLQRYSQHKCTYHIGAY